MHPNRDVGLAPRQIEPFACADNDELNIPRFGRNGRRLHSEKQADGGRCRDPNRGIFARAADLGTAHEASGSSSNKFSFSGKIGPCWG